ncbi:MAG: hypothetical protein JNK38_01240 [Acidobacteria bacterium]|nr:hypothetical protein [Acidobacteriota bacterium]
MRYLFLIACLLMLAVPVSAQIKPVVVELGPEAYSTLPRSGGYKWVARGYVYPPGTFTGGSDCPATPAASPIGTYAVFGERGSPLNHAALYRVTINGQQFFFGGIVERYDDESGQPGSTLFDLVRSLAARDEITEFADYTPRSGNCFGGRLKLYLQETNAPVRPTDAAVRGTDHHN